MVLSNAKQIAPPAASSPPPLSRADFALLLLACAAAWVLLLEPLLTELLPGLATSVLFIGLLALVVVVLNTVAGSGVGGCTRLGGCGCVKSCLGV